MFSGLFRPVGCGTDLYAFDLIDFKAHSTDPEIQLQCWILLLAVRLLAPPLSWTAPLVIGHGVRHKIRALRRVGILPPHRRCRRGAPAGVRGHGVETRVGASRRRQVIRRE